MVKDGKRLFYSDVTVDVEKGKNTNHVKLYEMDSAVSKTILSYDKNSVLIELAASADGDCIAASVMVDYAVKEIFIIHNNDLSYYSMTKDVPAPFIYMGTCHDKHYLISQEKADFGEIIAIPDGKHIGDAVSIIPQQDNRIIQNGAILNGKLLVFYMEDVASIVAEYTLEGRWLRNLELPSKLGTAALSNGIPSWSLSAENIFLTFESFTNPPSVLQYNGSALRILHSAKEVDTSNIVVTREFVTARDGQKLPAFIVHMKDVVLNGQNPTLMYGYGGYYVAETPHFNNPFVGIDIIEWVQKGYVYVNCNIRGGSEYGVQWHTGGNLFNKKNCFYDFIDIAEWMIDNQWTSPKKLAICGGSNGGLLMSALTTMRPDLWGAVIASVPHTDMIHFKNDDRGPMYITEYGDPGEEEMFHYILSYSPYHNVKKTTYPPIYIQTGECDNNVPPYHGKKLAARLQSNNQADTPVLLRVLATGSHDRGKGEEWYQTTAEMYTFIANALHLDD